MTRFSPSIVLKLTSSVVLATVISLGAAKAYGPNAVQGPAAAPAGPEMQAANPALAQFKDVLQRHGSILQHPRYGEVWTPSPGIAPAGWSPYPACRWVYDRQQNAWNYQDPTEWGSIVHHFGRWAFDRQIGWMWIADGTYGPGHVAWKTEGGQVSWAALTPDIDGGGPSEGWHSQDQQTFNAGCRQAAPAPVAVAPPPPAYAPAPIYAPAPVYASAPPVYVPAPRPIDVYVPAPRPVHIFVPFPHPGHGHFCHRFPHHPFCKKHGDLGPNSNPGPVHPCLKNPNLPFCSKLPPPKTNPGPLADGGKACAMFPNLPQCGKVGNGGVNPGPLGPNGGACKINPGLPFCSKFPNTGPNKKLAHLQLPFQKPFTRPPFVRPNPMLRPNHVFRPNVQIARPHVFRPGVQQRPQMMNRPSVQPRGFGGGGFRFAGGRPR